MKIAFHENTLNIRGTSVALYDYAHYNEMILGNKSIILTPRKADHDDLAVYKFSKRFQVIYYNNVSEIDSILEREQVDVFYVIKYGKNDGILSNKVKTVIHCVFDMSEPHGQVYAAVSETLAKKFGKTLFVPHMIGLQPSKTGENMRKSLGIPENAVVFGRYGGMDTWNLDYVNNAIVRAVNTKPNLYFMFINTPRFHTHPRILYLDKITDPDEKNRFINSCDFHIVANHLGDTFGLSIGEFSVNNKPTVLTGNTTWNNAHREILGNRAIYYHNEEDCYQLLVNLDPKKYKDQDWNCYSKYNPENVMQTFKKVFLE